MTETITYHLSLFLRCLFLFSFFIYIPFLFFHFRNQVGAGSTQYAFRESGSPVVSTGEKPVSRGCADRTRSVGVQKGQPFIRHLLQMGCFDFALRIGGRDVTDPEIIRHDQDDVGR